MKNDFLLLGIIGLGAYFLFNKQDAFGGSIGFAGSAGSSNTIKETTIIKETTKLENPLGMADTSKIPGIKATIPTSGKAPTPLKITSSPITQYTPDTISTSKLSPVVNNQLAIVLNKVKNYVAPKKSSASLTPISSTILKTQLASLSKKSILAI